MKKGDLKESEEIKTDLHLKIWSDNFNYNLDIIYDIVWIPEKKFMNDGVIESEHRAIKELKIMKKLLNFYT